jgi:hypothetical protein
VRRGDQSARRARRGAATNHECDAATMKPTKSQSRRFIAESFGD